MTPSPQQDAICDHVAYSSRNLIVEASPGSGKTTTIGMAARRIVPDGRLRLALAFAKMNAEDFARKLPLHVTSSTFHSACRGPVCDALGAKVVTEKVKYLLKDNFPSVSWQLYGSILKLVSLLKQQVGEVDIEDLAFTYGVDVSDSAIIPTTEALLDASDADTKRIDFDDMLRFALDARVRFPALALVFLDEAQDTNAVQRAILRKIMNYDNKPRSNISNDMLDSNQIDSRRTLPSTTQSTKVDSIVSVSTDAGSGLGARGLSPTKTKIVAVGDPFQSIFGFRGADHDAMTTLREELDADVLPLSVSYRCSVAVCHEAQRVLSDRRFIA